MEQQSTPGPWGWQKFGTTYSLVAQHGFREIIIGANPEIGSMQPMVVMNQDGRLQAIDPEHPNSKLIAAAPELLIENRKLKEQLTQVGLQMKDQELIEFDRQKALELIQYVKSVIERSDQWWMDCPDKGGFDMDKINAVLKNIEP